MKQSFGIRGISLNFFENYSSNCIQYTRVNNSRSTTSKLTCGVPQDSNLDLLLFLLYINDLPTTTKLETTPFADDTHLSYACNLLEKQKTEVNLNLK